MIRRHHEECGYSIEESNTIPKSRIGRNLGFPISLLLFNGRGSVVPQNDHENKLSVRRWKYTNSIDQQEDATNLDSPKLRKVFAELLFSAFRRQTSNKNFLGFGSVDKRKILLYQRLGSS